MDSPFLAIPESDWIASNALAFAIFDRFPVSPGHTLVVPRRLVATWFDATPDEQAALLALVDVVRRKLDAELHPDGYNLGTNVGAAAGQTVMHLHLHVIPRYRGDMDDPRGGVRHVIPSRGNYLRATPALATGGEHDPFARHVLPLFALADDITILAAFVQESGVERIRRDLVAALERGARVRLLTGDYLDITQANALETLLDWQSTHPGASADEPDEPRGRFEARVVEVARLPGQTRSFHPKAWRFDSTRMGVAFVGSSNLSRSALDTGIEWNLRVDRDRDATAYRRVVESFDRLWNAAPPLDAAWVRDYAARARARPAPLPQGELTPDAIEPAPAPHTVQQEALAALSESRRQGRRRALVVLATGLGKTWLAAFDHHQLRDELGSRPRLLFLAHRRELLRQAAGTWRRLNRTVDPMARIGWFVDDQDELSADLVFASVAKLARPEHLARLRGERFDYVVVDEVHHAAADSYRSILAALDPGFLLGLTATPDRADAADILGLFDDHLAYRADIARGVDVGRLVPFHYFGLKDSVDYAPAQIPWRNRRFDPAALARAVQTEARMETLWRAWAEHPGRRTLLFCCSIAHAAYVRDWLQAKGLRVAAVFSGEGSDDRDAALESLAGGALDAVCAVDVFNEGIDVPTVDRIVMLRPTESGVVFAQQLGRGLRASEGKRSVTVVDFVGNHRVFAERLRALFSLATNDVAARLRGFLSAPGPAELSAGCSIELELEAKDLLQRMLAVGGASEVERAYRELRVERGERPTAGELQRMGYLPGRLRDRYGSWFDYVLAEGDLSAEETKAVEAMGAFLREIETTEMTRCFKMVTLEALLEEDALATGMTLRAVALRAYAILRRSPELFADVAEAERVEALTPANEARWIAYWRRNPVQAWTGVKAPRRQWFRLDGERLTLTEDIDGALRPALSRLTRELVDYRLAQYRARQRQTPTDASFTCRVTWNQRQPILKIPRVANASLPEGETDVRLPDGAVWQFRFAKEFCNVARPVGADANELPALLRRWFGARAGQPGTAFSVRFSRAPGGWWVAPVSSAATELPGRVMVTSYPDLRAAAGHSAEGLGVPIGDRVLLPFDAASPDLFAVRVCGTSMDGGGEPLRDGDWAVMRAMRGAATDALVNRVVLAQVTDAAGDDRYHLKRLVRSGAGWQLVSDNPEGPTIAIDREVAPIARLEGVIRPESLGPPVGTTVREDELSARFGLDSIEARSGRYDGHLFVFVDRKGLLVEPDRFEFSAKPRRPGETAFVLAKQGDEGWRYLGVARRSETEGTWRIEAVDHATWRTWGVGRGTSRRLPPEALAQAETIVASLLARPVEERSLTQPDGRQARVLCEAPRGGLRIDGSDDGFAERTVSLQDIAWVTVAAEDVREHGGRLDEERVNRLRYLEGTPRQSTRWIDTSWALAAFASWRAGRGDSSA